MLTATKGGKINISEEKDTKSVAEKFSKLMQQRNASISIENILKLDKDKKLKISELQKLQTERNSISKLIGAYKKDQKETIDLEKKVTEIKRNTVEIEKSLKILEEKFPKIPFKEAMKKYGTDKPDLRNPLIIHDITSLFKRDDVQFDIFKK